LQIYDHTDASPLSATETSSVMYIVVFIAQSRICTCYTGVKIWYIIKCVRIRKKQYGDYTKLYCVWRWYQPLTFHTGKYARGTVIQVAGNGEILVKEKHMSLFFRIRWLYIYHVHSQIDRTNATFSWACITTRSFVISLKFFKGEVLLKRILQFVTQWVKLIQKRHSL